MDDAPAGDAFQLSDNPRGTASSCGLQAIPVCPFVASFLRKHPEYGDLVSPGSRRAYRIP